VNTELNAASAASFCERFINYVSNATHSLTASVLCLQPRRLFLQLSTSAPPMLSFRSVKVCRWSNYWI